MFRVGGPNGDEAVRKFIEQDLVWFGDYPDKRRSLGGRLENFIFCRGEHLTILTRSWLEELATDAGFGDLRACKPGLETGCPQWIDQSILALEQESTPECPHTVLMEGRRPGCDLTVEDRG
jgi:hypothetical protein